MSRPSRAIINLAALRHNYQLAKSRNPGGLAMAVIKANGYGHGLLTVANGLGEADAFAVASMDEAIILREAGIAQKILLLAGVCAAAELSLVDRYRLDIVVHCAEQVSMLESFRVQDPLNVWLKINTGMNRLGIAIADVVSLHARLTACQAVAIPLVLMTHFANADDRRDKYLQTQRQAFKQVTASLSGIKSIANSAATLFIEDDLGDWIRPGIMLYGASPFINSIGSDDGLKPVMTLESALIGIRQQVTGDPVGYGGAWVCPQDMLVGVVAIGYGDGYPWHAKAGTPVMVNGQVAKLVGRVSMDMITVDLTNIKKPKLGDKVILWGGSDKSGILPIEEVASSAGTISYELLCQVTARVKFKTSD